MRVEQQDLLRARHTRQRRLQVGANDVACFVFLAVNPITLLFEYCLDVVAGGGEGLRADIALADHVGQRDYVLADAVLDLGLERCAPHPFNFDPARGQVLLA
jgi:hypothetical protein